MSNPIITLTTDYGTSDHLTGVLKGVILKIVPGATIVDITHQVAAYDLLDGALCIGSAYRYFPPRTVHVVVVDPGVGTARRPVLVSAATQYFVAPDNGVLSLIYEREPDAVVRHVTAEHYFQTPISPTFHGRDVFAPVAAWLAKSGATEAFGEEIKDYVRFALPRPKPAGTGVKGLVLRVDSFGNLLTNLTREDLPAEILSGGPIKLTVAGKPVAKFAETFAQGVANEPVAIVGSSGFVEVAVNKSNASRVLGAGRGAEVMLEKG